ncbi:MAG: peptidylprolyl isomerase [Pseudomonadota bacterium]
MRSIFIGTSSRSPSAAGVTTGLAAGVLAGFAALVALAPAQAQEATPILETYDASTVLATVAGEEVTLGDLIAARKALFREMPQGNAEVLFSGLLDRLTQQRLLAKEATEQKLQDEAEISEAIASTERAFLFQRARLKAEADPELARKIVELAGVKDDAGVDQQLQALRNGLLSQAYISKTVEPKLTDDAVKAEYDRMITEDEWKAQFSEVRARHILVETKAEAEEILAALKGGSAFEELAAEKSKDNSRQNGGDLGYFRRGQMVPAFEEAAFGLAEAGDVSDVVQTDFGFHVIKLEDRRLLGLEQTSRFIRQRVIAEVEAEETKRLREKFGVALAEKLPPATSLGEDALLE